METEVETVVVDPVVIDPTVNDDEAAVGIPPVVDPVVDKEKAAEEAVQTRINKIAVEKNSEKSRADRLQGELDKLKQDQLPKEAPKLEDFEFDEGKHNAALIQHEVAKQVKEAGKTAIANDAATAQKKTADEFATREAKYKTTQSDYSEVVGQIPNLPQDTLEAIYSMDNGPQVAHYLGKHLDIAGEIANLSPTVAAVKLGQISAGLTANAKTVKTSKAPEPVETLSGQSALTKDRKQQSMSDIMADDSI